jgi:transcriptional regulator with XRE-family HTH domain
MKPPLPFPDNSSKPSTILPLPRLLKQLNKMLGWRPTDMAQYMKKDLSEISRLLNGHNKKPHIPTLEYIAEKYQEAGLRGVTVDHLIAARDFGGQVRPEKFALPAQWVRLVQTALSFDDEFADQMYRKWSMDLELSARLVWRGQIPPEDPPPN